MAWWKKKLTGREFYTDRKSGWQRNREVKKYIDILIEKGNVCEWQRNSKIYRAIDKLKDGKREREQSRIKIHIQIQGTEEKGGNMTSEEDTIRYWEDPHMWKSNNIYIITEWKKDGGE